jgi:hypothetical protein
MANTPRFEHLADGTSFRVREGLLVVMLLTGCASASSSQIAPRTYSVECRRSQANCYEEAARCCPQGFDVLDSAGRSKLMVLTNTNTYTGTSSSTVIPNYRGELLVRCNGAE